MKITKKQLRRLIKEETQKVLKEQWGVEAMNPLVSFAQSWAGLGSAVQEQIVTVVNGYVENRDEEVWEINPNALDLAYDRLGNQLNILSPDNPDADELLAALEWARGIFAEGDAEVEDDARAAGDL